MAEIDAAHAHSSRTAPPLTCLYPGANASYASQQANLPNTVMHRELAWPSDGFGSTGYVKGELFLRTLEDLLGRPTLDAFLDAYFARYAFHWVDDVAFLAALAPYVPANADLRLQEWLYQPGLPSNVTAATSSFIYTRVLQRAQSFNAGTPIAQLAPSTWTDTEIDLFLQLASAQQLRNRMAEIDAALALSSRTAPPLTWLIHGANASYAPAMPGIERILMRGGTNGAIQQLYNALRFTAANRAFANDVFAKARKRYHPAVEDYVAKMLASLGALSEAA
jgi:aminopeptidase N